jgi:hypothetical protein
MRIDLMAQQEEYRGMSLRISTSSDKRYIEKK